MMMMMTTTTTIDDRRSMTRTTHQAQGYTVYTGHRHRTQTQTHQHQAQRRAHHARASSLLSYLKSVLDVVVEHLVQHVTGRTVQFDLASVPCLLPKPGHSVQSIPLEDVASVEHAVVVHQHNVPRLHRQGHNIFAADFINVLKIRRWDGGEVAVVDVGHTHLRHTAGAVVPEIPGVVVDVAEPEGHVGLWVPVHRRHGGLHRLEPEWLSIGPIEHLQLHVKLRGHELRNHLFEEISQGRHQGARGREEVNVQV
mmetsp:Transcript_13358/g.38850  ORF Transcript_13358/g.38850 Transcript_13358/m.38850 type:complete len:253 (-) Transcript_13358:752-1510(-)